ARFFGDPSAPISPRASPPEDSLDRFTTSLPASLSWCVVSDRDEARAAAGVNFIDPEGRLFWRAIPYNHPQLFEDGANAHVISRLGLSAELCRAGTEVIAEQIRAKVCEPLSHVASAV